MKAARFHGPGDTRIHEVPDPEVICGTDLYEYHDDTIALRRSTKDLS